jgi:uncharacterized damage-inducible protein DinB
MSGTGTVDEQRLTGERRDLVDMLRRHRGFLLRTLDGMTDEQAGQRPTVSELCLGGIVKHVTAVERNWTAFIERGPSALGDFDAMTEADFAVWRDEFRMLPGDTVAAVREAYEERARATDALVAAIPDLDASRPLPQAPWFEPGGRWTARRTLMHILAETSQHAGHADIIRETIDGAKTMG